jgi:hypothetical protein
MPPVIHYKNFEVSLFRRVKTRSWWTVIFYLLLPIHRVMCPVCAECSSRRDALHIGSSLGLGDGQREAASAGQRLVDDSASGQQCIPAQAGSRKGVMIRGTGRSLRPCRV